MPVYWCAAIRTSKNARRGSASCHSESVCAPLRRLAKDLQGVARRSPFNLACSHPPSVPSFACHLLPTCLGFPWPGQVRPGLHGMALVIPNISSHRSPPVPFTFHPRSPPLFISDPLQPSLLYFRVIRLDTVRSFETVFFSSLPIYQAALSLFASSILLRLVSPTCQA